MNLFISYFVTYFGYHHLEMNKSKSIVLGFSVYLPQTLAVTTEHKSISLARTRQQSFGY